MFRDILLTLAIGAVWWLLMVTFIPQVNFDPEFANYCAKCQPYAGPV